MSCAGRQGTRPPPGRTPAPPAGPGWPPPGPPKPTRPHHQAQHRRDQHRRAQARRGQHRPGPDPWPGRWCYPPTGSCGFQPLNPHDRVRNVRTHHHASASQSDASYSAKGVFLIVLVRTGPIDCFYLWSREDCRSGRGHWREGEVLSEGRRGVLYILMRLRRGDAVPGWDNATRRISGRASSEEKLTP